MELNSIRNALKEQPFKPFELCLADGRRIPVKHPEFVAMNQRIVIVTDEESATRILEPLLIVSLEPSHDSTKAGNGSQKKKSRGGEHLNYAMTPAPDSAPGKQSAKR